jgi:hypothetical protein
MRQYNPMPPLERVIRLDPLRYWRCNNLLRDERGNIISDNFTYVTSDIENLDQLVKDIEATIKDCSPNIELAYYIMSGNNWLFLLYEGNPTLKELEHMQQAYEQVYDPQFPGLKA